MLLSGVNEYDETSEALFFWPAEWRQLRRLLTASR